MDRSKNYEEVVKRKVTSDLGTQNIALGIQEIPASELTVTNSWLWKGCPVHIHALPKNRPLTSHDMSLLQSFKFRYIPPFSFFSHLSSELSHPNIVSSHGYSQKDSQFVLVKEYMNLGNLGDWLKNTPLSKVMSHIGKIALDISQGMSHIHSKGYTWGSLSSHHIMLRGYLNEQGNGYLEAKIDFDCFYFLGNFSENSSEEEDISSFGNIISQLFTEGIGMELCNHMTLPIQYKDLIQECIKKDSIIKFKDIVDRLIPLVYQ